MTEKTNKIYSFIEFIGAMLIFLALSLSITFISINKCESFLKGELSNSYRNTKKVDYGNKLEKEKKYEIKGVVTIERDKYTDKILGSIEGTFLSRIGKKGLKETIDILEETIDILEETDNKHKSYETVKNDNLIIPKGALLLELYSEHECKFVDKLFKDETLKNLAVYEWEDSNDCNESKLNKVLICGNLGIQFINMDEIYMYKIIYK